MLLSCFLNEMNDFQADEKHPFSRGDKNEIPQEERDCFINISSLIINFNFIHLFIFFVKEIESKIRKSERNLNAKKN